MRSRGSYYVTTTNCTAGEDTCVAQGEVTECENDGTRVCSEQSISARVRQRRWKRERMLVRSTGLPLVLNESLLTKTRLAAMVRPSTVSLLCLFVRVLADVAIPVVVVLRSNTPTRS